MWRPKDDSVESFLSCTFTSRLPQQVPFPLRHYHWTLIDLKTEAFFLLLLLEQWKEMLLYNYLQTLLFKKLVILMYTRCVHASTPRHTK